MKGFGKSSRKTTLQELRQLPPDVKKKVGKMTEYTKKDIYIHSRVSSKDKKPMVDMSWGKNKTEFTPTEAFDFALGVIQCAIAAETDSLLIEFVTRILELEIEIAGALLLEFRQFREDSPKRFTSWRGQALEILKAAETTEADEFLRSFLEKVKASGDNRNPEEFDIEKVIEDFQELRDSRRVKYN